MNTTTGDFEEFVYGGRRADGHQEFYTDFEDVFFNQIKQ